MEPLYAAKHVVVCGSLPPPEVIHYEQGQALGFTFEFQPLLFSCCSSTESAEQAMSRLFDSTALMLLSVVCLTGRAGV